MKPAAWCVSYDDPTGLIYSNPTMYKPGAESMVSKATSPIALVELYSAATIRNWLLECSEEMWRTGANTEGGTDDKYRAMIALKLEELK